MIRWRHSDGAGNAAAQTAGLPGSVQTDDASTAARKGFTYVELVASTVITGLLMLGIGSVMYVAGQTLNSSGSVVARRAAAGEIVSDLADDLRHAIRFSQRTATAVEFTVPDRTGDQLPDTVSYSWSGTPGDPLMYSFNGATPTAIADDVHQFDLDYISTSLGGVQPPPTGGTSVLFVVANPNALTRNETERRDLLESWGYQVHLINDGTLDLFYYLAFLSHDVVYVSQDVGASKVGSKLRSARIGVVCEEEELVSNLGFADGSAASLYTDSVSVLSDGHYITADHPTGTRVAVVASPHSLSVIVAEQAGPGNFSLAAASDGISEGRSIVTLDPGDSMNGGSQVAGRRVHLPWGSASTSALTGDGLYLLKRAIEWGAGAGDQSPLRRVLMVVADPDNLTSLEQQRKALLQDMGYKVPLVAATAPWFSFDTAVADADVAYVPSHISAADLGTKLRASAIGVVNESNDLHSELGLVDSDGDFEAGRDEIVVVEKRHYITQPLPVGAMQIFNSGQPMTRFSGNLGSAVRLADTEGGFGAALATLETGMPMRGPNNDPAPARRVYLPWGGQPAFDVNHLNSDGRLILQRSLEWVAGAESEIPGILLVVANAGSLNSDEDDRLTQLERFGYLVTPISDSESSGSFDDAVASADLVYVCETVNSADLGSKLNGVSIGIVNEQRDLIVELGFSDAEIATDGLNISLTDTSHYITEGFSVGPLPVFSSAERIKYLSGTKAAGVQTLGTDPASGRHRALAVMATGAALHDSGTAAGRRVSLPWGDGVPFSRLTPEALTILERSLAWARGIGDDGVPDAAPENVGYESDFASEQSLIENRSVAMKVTLEQASMFTSLSGLFHDQDRSVRYAIYSDNSGEPGNLLVETDKVSPPGSGPQWTTLNVAPTILPAGDYWLAFGIDSNNQKYFYDADATQQVRYRNYDPVTNGFLTTWGVSDAALTQKISFYGTFTPQ
ncbi:MAG: hypothetical protein RIK87_00220 [Fuerstiella sp.]